MVPPASVERPSRTILLAETDRYILARLPRILFERLPHVAIDICPSPGQLSRMMKNASYDTVAMSPRVMQDYRSLKQKSGHHVLVPLIVTASQDESQMAEASLKGEAFDLIVKPLIPHQAARTIRLALWQNQLLRLLASKERAASRFHDHMKAFPHAFKMQQELAEKLAAYDRTIHALSTSMRRLLNFEEEQSAFDMAALVEQFTKQRALDRLFNLCKEGATR